MKVTHNELISEFFKEIKEEYPDLTYKECEEICSFPFKETRKHIESEELPVIRLKYFGTFVPYPKRVKGILKQYENLFKLKKIDQSKYFKKREMLTKHLKKHEEN